jgi:2-dehydro-3-deoxygalactonokinase
MTVRPVLIGLDWGTTAMRAYLFDANGQVVDSRASSDGIMRLPQAGGFDAAFEAACGDWLALAPDLPVIAAGLRQAHDPVARSARVDDLAIRIE